MAIFVWFLSCGINFSARLHGTEPVKYGLTKRIKEIDPISLVTHEWKGLGQDVKQCLL